MIKEMNLGYHVNARRIHSTEIKKAITEWISVYHGIEIDLMCENRYGMNHEPYFNLDIKEEGLTEEELEKVLEIFDGTTNGMEILNVFLKENHAIEQYRLEIDNGQEVYLIYEY